MLFFTMSFQFVIMEMTIMLINYSYNQRQQNKKKMEKASCDGGLQS